MFLTRTKARVAAIGLMVVLAAVLVLALRRSPTVAPVEFNRDIRPILAENCYTCHGPDARKRKAGLRLDEEAGARATLADGHRAVVPGDPDESELVFRVETDDPETRMPPPRSGKSLDARQVALLKMWVEAGARWEPHWSLAPVKRPDAPTADDPAFPRTPIDAFVLAKLKDHGLPHAPEADRITLIRRLSFDLLGLPPKPEEVDRFVADRDPRAYENLVDRLLASPHYGERMAMFWLDLVRYADSVGYHGDQEVSVSPFRDYVIKAFNENKRFDQFTVEQLAGDLLPSPTLDQQVAAAYNRLGMMTAEFGAQPKEYLAKYAAERVRNVSGAWLGITLGCAECHDHKFDPFTTRDFYRMEAFFADIDERGGYTATDFGPSIPVPDGEQREELARIDARIAEVNAVLDRPTPELAAAQAAWEASVNPRIDWAPLTPVSAASAGGATLTILPDDGSVLALGTAPATDTYTVTVKRALRGVTAIRLEALPDETLPANGPGRAADGDFVLTELKVSLRGAAGATPRPVALARATASFERSVAGPDGTIKVWSAASAIDGDPGASTPGWSVAGEPDMPNEAIFETAVDLNTGDDALLVFELAQDSDNPGHTLGRFRLSATTAPRPIRARGAGLAREAREILSIEPSRRIPRHKDALAAYYRRAIAPTLAPERTKLAGLEKNRTEILSRATTTLATMTVPPRTIRVLARGNWMDDSGEEVSPGVPGALPQPPAKEGRLTRLDLARWIVAPDNPLTARVLVNRLWRLYFGAGLSRKVDDLGAQGEPPSHPELLDWLAGSLIDSGWDLKATIRQIVTSGVYRQSSVAPREAREKDPFNRWLGRQGRFRLDAEIVRDTALRASGLLVEDVGGTSVRPYQPPGYWSFLNFPTRDWQNDRGPRLYRRGLYTHWQRQYLHPSLLAFDAPSREECTAERVRSNTPLQALVLLNDPSYVEASLALAERALREGGSNLAERLDWASRRVLSRPARADERAVLTALYRKHLDDYRKDPEAAKALLGIGGHHAPGNLDPSDLAAWTSVARALLNLHATITRN